MRNVIRHLCLCIVLLFCGTAMAQSISGTVTDDSNLPLPGASVLVQGTTNSTVTDIDGKYTLQNVAANAVLEFSFVGFASQSISISGRTTIDISLKTDSNELEEIVLVGASVKRSDLTGAVASISGDKLKETPTPNVVQGLQGRIAGVYIQQNANPAGSASIQIRGNNSLQFGTNPIFVVDGLIMEGNFENINPNDIASIDVLKSASATAIYGARGANGVVVITTKKGSRNGAGKIEYETWVGVSEFARKVSLMNGKQIFDLRVDAYANAYADGNYTNPGIPAGLNRSEFTSLVTSNGSPLFGQYELDSYRAGKSYNWLDQVTRTGVQLNQNLSFSGGGEKGTYFVSFNYVDNQGLLKESGFKRYNGKVNIVQDVKPWLQMGTNTTFSRSLASYQEGSAFGTALGANPLLPIDPTATYLKYGSTDDVNQYNPILSLAIKSNSTRNMFTSSNFVNIKPTKGLDIRTTLSATSIDQGNFDYTPTYTGQSIRNAQNDNNGIGHHWRYSEYNYQWDNTVTYNKTFNDAHDLSIIGGYSVTKNTNNSTDVTVKGFVSDDFYYLNLGAASDKPNFSVGSNFLTSTLMSYFGRANYDYKKKYFLTGTLRYDGSSRFGANNKWGAFPSAALGWDVAKEDFLKGVEKINQLKLRVDYGLSGNQNIPIGYYNTLYTPSYTNGTITYTSNNVLGNPNLKWEKQKQLNVGVDFAAFDNRLGMVVNYFSTHNDDLLMLRDITPVSGYDQQLDNIGAMVNKGFEFSVNGSLIRSTDVNWDLAANISSARNKVTKLHGDVDTIWNYGGYNNTDIQQTGNFFLGKPVNSIYVYQYEKIAQESDMAALSQMDFGGRIVKPGDIVPVDRNHDGKINDADRYVVGNTSPDFYGGFNTNFTYKGFGINAVFAYSVGGKRISNIYSSYMNSAGMSAAHTDLLNRWTPDNTNTDIPRAYSAGGRFNLSETDKAIQDASYLRLNALSLSYNLPSSLAEKVYLKGVKIYVTGSNLFTVTKYKGYDPEGGDYYPISRMYVMGVNVSL